MVLSWLMFTAYQTMSAHITFVESVLRSLRFALIFVGYFEEAEMYYVSPYLAQLTLIRNFMLIGFALIGLVYCISDGFNENPRSLIRNLFARIRIFFGKKKVHAFFAILLFLDLVLSVIFLFGVKWQLTWSGDIRTRILPFAFVPIAIFFAQGVCAVENSAATGRTVKNSNRFPKNAQKTILALVLLVVFVPSTIAQAFPRYFYDPTYSLPWVELPPVAPEHQYALSLWVLFYVDPLKYVFTGSLDGPPRHSTYILGYGHQREWSDRMFNVTFIRSPRDTGYVVLYVVNTYNTDLPDRLGRKLDASTLQFISEHFGRICDNGVMILHVQMPS